MSDKVKVSEIAKELGINSKEVIDKAATMGLVIKAVSSSVSMEEAEKIMNFVMSGAGPTESAAPKVAVKKADKEPKEQIDNGPKVVEASVILAAPSVSPAVDTTSEEV
jgi:translation initiation factor IF-2